MVSSGFLQERIMLLLGVHGLQEQLSFLVSGEVKVVAEGTLENMTILVGKLSLAIHLAVNPLTSVLMRVLIFCVGPGVLTHSVEYSILAVPFVLSAIREDAVTISSLLITMPLSCILDGQTIALAIDLDADSVSHFLVLRFLLFGHLFRLRFFGRSLSLLSSLSRSFAALRRRCGS